MVSLFCLFQVPSWRLKIYTSCYTMEGTENLDDEVFNKRHQRLEIDERRRKRYILLIVILQIWGKGGRGRQKILYPSLCREEWVGQPKENIDNNH